MPDPKIVLRLSGGGPPRNPEKEVIGRDQFVKEMMGFLEYTSVQLAAPRRIGKSWVLYLLESKAKVTAMPIYFDLERVHTPYEFVDVLAKKTKSIGKQVEAALGKLIEQAAKSGHGKMSDYEFPWKEHLDGILKKLNNQSKPVWLIFDEFPLFLNLFISNGQHETSIQLLDYLRFAQDEYRNIRFVITGSIGLHWIIKKLKEKGWRNPQNKDQRLTLRVLDKEDAVFLTEGLFRGINADTAQANDLSEAANQHPFYIQKAIGLWHRKKEDEGIIEFCDRMALETEDHFEFSELDKRLGDYFGREAGLARRVLDALAEETPVSVRDIARQLSKDPEEIKSVMDNLQMDGYTEVKDNHYHLWPSLFRRWWKNQRGGLYE